MNENPLTNLYFFVYSHNHAAFSTYTIGQIGGCVAPGWFLVSFGANNDTTLSDTSMVVRVEDMTRWVFLPTMDDARRYKMVYKSQQGR